MSWCNLLFFICLFTLPAVYPNKISILFKKVPLGGYITLISDWPGKIDSSSWMHDNHVTAKTTVATYKGKDKTYHVNDKSHLQLLDLGRRLNISNTSWAMEGYYSLYVNDDFTNAKTKYKLEIDSPDMCEVENCKKIIDSQNLMITFTTKTNRLRKNVAGINVTATCSDNTTVNICDVPLGSAHIINGDTKCKFFETPKQHTIVIPNGTLFQQCKVFLTFDRTTYCYEHADASETIEAKDMSGTENITKSSSAPEPATTMVPLIPLTDESTTQASTTQKQRLPSCGGKVMISLRGFALSLIFVGRFLF